MSISLINELEYNAEDHIIRRILNICKFWFEKFDKLNNETLLKILTEQLISLSVNENSPIFDLSLDYFLIFDKYLTVEQKNKILDNYISLISPIKDLGKSSKIANVIIQRKDILTSENLTSLLNRLVDDLNEANRIKNDTCYSYWTNILNSLKEKFENGNLDLLIERINPKNLLHIDYPDTDIEARNKYCSIIISYFEKFSEQRQNIYFNLFVKYLTTNSKENSEYSINNIFPLRTFLLRTDSVSTLIPLLIDQFSIDINSLIKLKNVKILFTCIDQLTVEQIEEMLEVFSDNCYYEPSESVNLLIGSWENIQEKFKFRILKNLLPTEIIKNSKLLEDVLKNVISDFGNLPEEDIIAYITQRESDLKNTEIERDLYAKIINRINSQFTADLKSQLRTMKIAEIKAESDINLCRHKISTLIGIKDIDYEKDVDINDLFVSLLNDTLQKKKLAIDVFEFYYTNNHPHKRKRALEERFENLMSELDNDYKKRLHHLANKYDLKVKKSFWSIFGN